MLLGIGQTLAGRLLLFDALETEFTELKLRRDPNCPVCSTEALAARAEGRPLDVANVGEDAPFLLTTTGARRQGLAGGARVSTVFIPAVLRANVGGVKSLELEGDSIRGVVEALVAKHPALGSQLLTDGRRPQPVRQRLRQRAGRPLPGRARYAGRPGRRGPTAAGDGRRLRPMAVPALRAVDPDDRRRGAARRIRISTSTTTSRATAGGSRASSTRSGTRRSSRSRGCRRSRPSGSSSSSRCSTRQGRSRTASRST